METKHCYKCDKQKALELFSKNGSRPDVLNSMCRECSKAYRERWYNQNRDKHIENVAVVRDRHKTRNITRLYEYLLGHPCVDCGEADPIVIEFDHVRGEKAENISHIVSNGYAWSRVWAEIEKCEAEPPSILSHLPNGVSTAS